MNYDAVQGTLKQKVKLAGFAKELTELHASRREKFLHPYS